MIGLLLFPPKSYFICFPVQKTDLRNIIYKEKNPSFPGLLQFPGSVPLFQPLTSPPIFQALFFLHNFSQMLSRLFPHLSLVWGTVSLFFWLPSMKLYCLLVLHDHRMVSSSTAFSLTSMIWSQLSCWHTDNSMSSWVPTMTRAFDFPKSVSL